MPARMHTHGRVLILTACSVDDDVVDDVVDENNRRGSEREGYSGDEASASILPLQASQRGLEF